MPNNDYIKRSDAVSAFCGNCEATEVCGYLGEPCEELKRIKAIPDADVEPVRHEKWEVTTLDGLPGRRPISFFCSGCLLLETKRTPFCPYCGAKMDKGVDGGT